MIKSLLSTFCEHLNRTCIFIFDFVTLTDNTFLRYQIIATATFRVIKKNSLKKVKFHRKIGNNKCNNTECMFMKNEAIDIQASFKYCVFFLLLSFTEMCKQGHRIQ